MPSLPVGELDRVFETYGHNGYMGLVKLADSDAYRNATAEEVLATFSRQPTPTTSYFFRDSSLQVIAEKVAPAIAPLNSPLEVRHAGGGPGHEAYSFGALLAGNGISFYSASVDVNPDVQPEEEAPTFTYHWNPADYFDWESDANRYVRPYFDIKRLLQIENGYPAATFLVSPKKVLTDHVDFVPHNLLTGPPPGNPDITLARNIMWHYPWATRDVLLQHALGGMAKGIVALETKDNHTPVADYNDWVASLGRFGLTPCARLRWRLLPKLIRQRIFDYDVAANTML